MVDIDSMSEKERALLEKWDYYPYIGIMTIMTMLVVGVTMLLLALENWQKYRYDILEIGLIIAITGLIILIKRIAFRRDLKYGKVLVITEKVEKKRKRRIFHRPFIHYPKFEYYLKINGTFYRADELKYHFVDVGDTVKIRCSVYTMILLSLHKITSNPKPSV